MANHFRFDFNTFIIYRLIVSAGGKRKRKRYAEASTPTIFNLPNTPNAILAPTRAHTRAVEMVTPEVGGCGGAHAAPVVAGLQVLEVGFDAPSTRSVRGAALVFEIIKVGGAGWLRMTDEPVSNDAAASSVLAFIRVRDPHTVNLDRRLRAGGDRIVFTRDVGNACRITPCPMLQTMLVTFDIVPNEPSTNTLQPYLLLVSHFRFPFTAHPIPIQSRARLVICVAHARDYHEDEEHDNRRHQN